MAEGAKKLGKDAPNYDLCNVTVPRTNMFCADKLRSEKYPDGVPRIEMLQLGGEPIPGTEADELPRNPWDPKEVDGAGVLNRRGFTTARHSRNSLQTPALSAIGIGARRPNG